MKNALCVAVFALTVMALSAAAYAQTGTPAPAAVPNAAPAAATSGATPNGMAPAPHRHGPCRTDVQSFCSNVPRANGQILACLKAHIGQLSPSCEAAMKRHADQQQTTPAPAAGGAVPAK